MRGRPKKNTHALTMRLNVNTIESLMSINPSLVTRDPSSQKLKFRHGALGRYVERLISEDLDERRKRIRGNVDAIAADTGTDALQAFLSSDREHNNNPNLDETE